FYLLLLFRWLLVFYIISLPPLLSSALFFFFFYCSRHHRPLHSFPTRRSSDLADIARHRHGVPTGATILRGGVTTGGPGADGANRSEEHTSELQSRFDLVCRLLLEKKNADGMVIVSLLPTYQLLLLSMFSARLT